MNYILLDLDGTIAQAGDREIFFNTDPKNYAAAEAGIIYDSVIDQTRKVLDLFVSNGYEIVVLTARSENCRQNCIDWLNLVGIPFKDIYLRPKDNYVKDFVIKEQLLDEIIDKYGTPYFALDDRPDVIEMFNRRGIFAFGVYKPSQ